MPPKHQSRESKYSPRRIEAAKRQAQALELRMAGRTWWEIAQALNYKTPEGPQMAVKAALSKTLTPPAEQFRALALERLSKVVQVFWPAFLRGDERSGMMVLRAVADIRQLLGLDAPVKVQVDIREEATRIAKELGLNPDDVMAEAERILGK